MNSIEPLRISKNTPSSTPNKKMATSRPLAEIGSTSQRRNSPSYNQATRKMIVSRETSPYLENSVPFSPKLTSPRELKDRMSPFRYDENTLDRSPSPSVSPQRRTSIERLKQSGRVKNSNIFALESKDAYDPASLPIVERPSANRPISQQLANNSFTRFDSLRKENNPLRSPQRPGHKRTDTEISIPRLSPTKEAASIALPPSPEKQSSPSPAKSSMARTSMFGTSQLFDADMSAWSDEERSSTPRALHRHNKSVTFHAEPPVINEYEEQTPEPSVSLGSRESSYDSQEYEDQSYSFDRGSSVDRPENEDSFDADLENADKTPVVLPEDWSRMSPDAARTHLANHEDDVFDAASPTRPAPARSASVTSDGEPRPLPPLPSFMSERKRRDSGGLTGAAERASHAARNMPAFPKRASCSKDDILQMTRRSSLSLDDRLKMLSEHGNKDRTETAASEHAIPEELTITNLDTGDKMDVQIRVADAPVEDDSIVADLSDFVNAPPRISRESILRKVRNTKYDFDDESDVDESTLETEANAPRPSYAELAQMHPDEPIESRENSRETSETVLGARTAEQLDEVYIKPEPTDDDEIDLAAIPHIDEHQLHPPRSPSRMDDYDRQTSVLHHPVRSESAEEDEDDASRYSSAEPEAESTVLHDRHLEEVNDGKETLQEAMQLLTVKDYSEPASQTNSRPDGDFMGLPTYLGGGDYDFGIQQYITPSPPTSSGSSKQLDLSNAPKLEPSTAVYAREEAVPPTYAAAEISPPSTPDSVVQHRTSDVSSMHDQPDLGTQMNQEYTQEPKAEPEIIIPERKATIKTGGKLKARPSASQADFEAMTEQRRLASGEYPVPAIPDTYKAQPEKATNDRDVRSDDRANESSKQGHNDKSQLDISIPEIAASEADDLAVGLQSEFDRLIESQKKGYLMRQNTKVVVASNRNFSNDSNGTNKSANESGTEPPMSPTADARPTSARRAGGKSPRKASAEQFLKTEPWNGKMRRKSLRNASAQTTAYAREPAPPLPGQESALGVVDNDYAAGMASLDEEVEEGTERGRLFVKVVGVKNLDLPMPKNDRMDFQLTLDNGLHCVTTANLELGKSAPIGQEFELVVQDDLEFQLTLTTQLPPPPKAPANPTPSSPTKSLKSQKTGGFASRFLSSPKKRAERERAEREAAEAEERRLQTLARISAPQPPTAWDQLRDLVNATDGAFARAYVNLKSHETQCFGRQVTVDVPCYNEWALEKDAQVVNSVRSKRGAAAGPVRKPPYVIGQLEVQLLYVPKPRGATDEEMPKSMGSAVREMARAEAEKKEREASEVSHEGCLSQQGGDCQHWRRRFFRLQSSRLTAYHEHTHQKRAVINLVKATRLVDDKTTLVADPAASSSPTKSGSKGRRKSAFAEEDEGYQYVEEGFRIRFANGETIDFYADSRAEKEEWMRVLSRVVGKPDASAANRDKKPRWTDLVLAREKVLARGSKSGSDENLTAVSSSPVKPAGSAAPKPAVDGGVAKRKSVPTSSHSSPVKGAAAPPPTQRPPPPPGHAARPKTPPMAERKGHRSRNAVKSMIF